MDADILLLSSPPHSFCSSVRKDMASVSTKTNGLSLKRTYTLVRSNPPSPSDPNDTSNPFKVPALSPSAYTTSGGRMSLSLKRRYPFCKSQAGPPTTSNTSSVPAFVSIFDTDMSGCTPTTQTPLQYQGFSEQIAAQPAMTSGSALSLQHHNSNSSVSTSASSSNNSSPTTTISTVDSANSDEQSTPDSSPSDSLGDSLMALPSFRTRGRLGSDLTIVPPSPGFSPGRPQSPSKKPRNTKNLSLNVPPSPGFTQLSGPRPFGSVGHNSHSDQPISKSMSAPPSPAFIVPPPPQNPRRRPSNLGLTIKLPGMLSDKPTSVGPLRHHQSSPSLFSPSLAPSGGMTLPLSPGVRQTTFQFQQRPVFNNRWASETASSGSSSAASNSPPKSPEILHEMDEDDDEPPRSGEAKSPAYPAGPALIFEPNIYLFAEPNAELASQFDVVINVAREVLNPFKAAANKDVPISPVPDTGCTEASFKTAFEEAMFSPMSFRNSMDLPKTQANEPEYIHLPWDHNTAILDDLPALVELISERANEGKKVLVHCQCGVSRSATLLIAYSMFKNPEKSMQDAYSAVKAKSKWIGPNMSLIYQLTDWKKMISSEGPKALFGGWRGPATGGLRNNMAGSGGLGRGRETDRGNDSDYMNLPQTAPLPQRRSSPSVSPTRSPQDIKSDASKLVRTRSDCGGFASAMSLSPSSAPPGMVSVPKPTTTTHNRQSWPDGDEKLSLSTPPGPSPRPQEDTWSKSCGGEPPEPTRMPPPPPPAPRPISDAYSLDKYVMPGRFERDYDDSKAPPSASISSPRSSGIWNTVPSRRMSPWNALFSDPRSPNERTSSSPTVRNIFDVLL